MKTITAQLPTVLGSFSAMLVAFLGLLNGTSATTSLLKAVAAFLVFSGFGLILRYTLSESQDAEEEHYDNGSRGKNLDVIVPGTSVADLLNNAQDGVTSQDDSSQEEQAA